ncbi:hypothetical protein D3C81_931570 [compost metagenome]
MGGYPRCHQRACMQSAITAIAQRQRPLANMRRHTDAQWLQLKLPRYFVQGHPIDDGHGSAREDRKAPDRMAENDNGGR